MIEASIFLQVAYLLGLARLHLSMYHTYEIIFGE